MASEGKFPRIILYSGKGGVGKTTIAAATGLRCSELGYRTLVLSIDVAHSLSDSFDRPVGLFDHARGQATQIREKLWLQEIDVQEDVERYWGDIYRYFAALFRNSGLDQIMAEELAIFPGMEEVCALLYVNDYLRNNAFDVLVLDCAPTGESLRFISMPSTLEWYMRKLFKIERAMVRVARPIAKVVTDVPLPGEDCFDAIQRLFDKLEGVDRALIDRDQTTVRLVTNPEKMVVSETQRAFLYFCMYGMAIDSVVVNRIIPKEAASGFFSKWRQTQDRYYEIIRDTFSPVPLRTVELFEDEVMGMDRLHSLAEGLYGDENPTQVLFEGKPFEFLKNEEGYLLKVQLPFADKKHLDVFKKEDQLIIRIGGFKRHVGLPKSLRCYVPRRAALEGNTLTIPLVMRENSTASH